MNNTQAMLDWLDAKIADAGSDDESFELRLLCEMRSVIFTEGQRRAAELAEIEKNADAVGRRGQYWEVQRWMSEK